LLSKSSATPSILPDSSSERGRSGCLQEIPPTLIDHGSTLYRIQAIYSYHYLIPLGLISRTISTCGGGRRPKSTASLSIGPAYSRLRQCHRAREGAIKSERFWASVYVRGSDRLVGGGERIKACAHRVDEASVRTRFLRSGTSESGTSRRLARCSDSSGVEVKSEVAGRPSK
jgi:hypothetical protein